MTSAPAAALARKLAPFALPAIAILLARAMTYTDWAAAHATLAALLFAWIVVDSLCLATLAKAPRKRPGLHALLGAATFGGLVVLLGAAPAIRSRIFELTGMLMALGLTATLWMGVAICSFVKARRAGASLEAALGQILPQNFVHFLLQELRMMYLAIFVWRGRPDVPDGTQAFAYHRYLAPMLLVFVGLQVIELGVVHLLLILWKPVVAWIVLALSIGGLLWTVAFIKSLRLNPVLLANRTLRVRSAWVYDVTVPFDAIASLDEPIAGAELKSKSTLNLAIMSAPNVSIRLKRPIAVPRLIGDDRMIEKIALRLDDAASFHSEIETRLA